MLYYTEKKNIYLTYENKIIKSDLMLSFIFVEWVCLSFQLFIDKIYMNLLVEILDWTAKYLLWNFFFQKSGKVLKVLTLQLISQYLSWFMLCASLLYLSTSVKFGLSRAKDFMCEIFFFFLTLCAKLVSSNTVSNIYLRMEIKKGISCESQIMLYKHSFS